MSSLLTFSPSTPLSFSSTLPLHNSPPHPHPHQFQTLKLSPRAVILSPDPPTPTSPPKIAPPTHLLTILSQTPKPPSQILNFLSSLHITLSPLRTLSQHAFDLRLNLPPNCDIDSLRHSLNSIGNQTSSDVTLQHAAVALEPKRLAVFDLDSTLIAQETIDELAAIVNKGHKVRAITEAAMNGEIGFREALARRVALLKGLHVNELDLVKERVVFTAGAREVVRVLGRLGCRTALVSGGFHFLADHVRDELGLDESYANRLEVDHHGQLTGRTIGVIVDAEYKDTCLRRLAEEGGLRKEQVLAVGDGSNDLLMIGSAGLGVAFNAKPIVQHRAKARVNLPSLRNVLYLLGLDDGEIDALLQ